MIYESNKLKILFIGDFSIGHCANSLVDGFRTLDVDLRTLDTSDYMRKQQIGSKEWFQRKFFEKPSSTWIGQFKQRIYASTDNWYPDVLFCINTIHIPQDILFGIDCRTRAHLSYDDVNNPENLTLDYLSYEKNWDFIFTNKSYNVPEIQSRTKSKVVLFQNAYNPTLHLKNKAFKSRFWDIGFIGANRSDRDKLPRQLQNTSHLKIVVAGPRWKRSYPLGVRGIVFMPEVLNYEYTKLGNNIKAGFCLLNSSNRDDITTRSYELPALGQLVIGKKTKKHEELLENGKEAFWFDTTEEMINFSREILKNKSKSQKVSIAGFKRITQGSNSYRDRANQILTYFK